MKETFMIIVLVARLTTAGFALPAGAR